MRKWTQREEKILTDLWFQASPGDLLQALPRYSWTAIRRKAAKLKLKRIYKYKDWNDTELSILIGAYAQNKSRYQIENLLPNRSWMSIKSKANLLRLKKLRVERPIVKGGVSKIDKMIKGKTVRFGIASDSHFGSKYSQITYLHKFYALCEKEGVDFMVNPGDVCVIPETLITTKKGYIPISKIKKGDEVLTHKNRFRKVINVFKRSIDEQIIHIKLRGDSIGLKATQNHPVFTSKKQRRYNKITADFIPIKELEINHLLINRINREFIKDIASISFSNSIADKIKSTLLPSEIKLNKLFLKIIGYFLGDGTAKVNEKRGVISFSLGTKKEKTCKKDIEKWFNQNHIKYYKNERKKMTILTVNSKPLAQFFRSFYNEKKEKYLPEKFIKLPFSKWKWIIYGLIMTDGAKKEIGCRICNTSLILLQQIKSRCENEGIIPTLILSRSSRRRKIMGRFCNQKDYYELGFNNESCRPIFKMIINKDIAQGQYFNQMIDYIFKFIREKKKIDYKGYVWNLEVEEDNSYIANNIILHNCDGNGEHYKGQRFEMHITGADNMKKFIIVNYPRIKTRGGKECKTYYIQGYHDLDWWIREGYDLMKEVSEKREDMVHLGHAEAILQIQNKKIMLSHPSGGTAYALCFDEKTEILTEEGWKLFKDLDKTEKVATMNPETSSFEWQKPSVYTDEMYEGKMFHFKSRNIDLLVTPNHRMFVRKNPINIKWKKEMQYPQKSHRRINRDWQFVEAQNLKKSNRQEWQMTKRCKWKKELTQQYIEIPYRELKKYSSHPIKHFGKLKIEDITELIGWYVTEGHIDKNKNVCLSICQSKEKNHKNHNEILNLFQRIGLPAKAYGKRQKDISAFSVELCDFLLANCGRGSYNKYLPKWLKEQPKKILEILFTTMIKGDGWINGKGFGYRSVSKQLRDDMSEIAIKLGYSVTFWNDSLSITKNQITPTINKNPQEISYNGKIYCVSVPNTLILVRRNGKMVWSGNSYRTQKKVEGFSSENKPDILIVGHYHKAEYIPLLRNIYVIQAACFQAQTPYAVRKGLFFHYGGWIVEFTLQGGDIVSMKTEFIPFYNTISEDYRNWRL